MKRTEDFFIPENKVKLPEELDYSRVDEYIRSAEAFSRSSYQSVYIIDYFKQNFPLCISKSHVLVHHVGTSEYFEYNLVTRRWSEKHIPALTQSEKSVLTLSIKGYTINEIADKMFLSTETIKKYRKSVFEKLDVKNMSEAIMAASNNKLL